MLQARTIYSKGTRYTCLNYKGVEVSCSEHELPQLGAGIDLDRSSSSTPLYAKIKLPKVKINK